MSQERPGAPAAAPQHLRLEPRRLLLDWPDASVGIEASRLRAACPCAACRQAARRGDAPAGPGVELVDVQPVGAYAVQLRFSDTHDKGIYPWAYLQALAQEGR